jgi:hypothetical protein
MKRKQIIISQLAFILSVSLLLVEGAGCAGPVRGSEPATVMTDLSNLDQLKQAIERDRGKVRIVSLLSPV